VPILQLHQISKSFTDTLALNSISLALDQGQILCLLGPSGCGKTTLLLLIAGLEKPDSGVILFKNRDISNIPPHQRDFGLMFQEFALFPHKTVAQNVAFGLQMKHEDSIAESVAEMLKLVGLAGFEQRDISSLSGGERQRVALARSLAPNPELLMLDEPLGALDRALRERLMLEIRQILKKVALTAIYVTHDQAEAFAIADRVVVMHQGHIEQDATPEQLYQWPATPFVASFLGFTNLLEATCLANDRLETDLGTLPVSSVAHPPGQKVIVLIRPEAASFEPIAGFIAIEGDLVNVSFRGRFYLITISTSGLRLTFEMLPAQMPTVGSRVSLWLDPAKILLLPASEAKNQPG
jgi:ABC-type Fe3+/spermidine/putrescine transport system ATPase subunit